MAEGWSATTSAIKVAAKLCVLTFVNPVSDEEEDGDAKISLDFSSKLSKLCLNQ
jgi:hypothetical protein